MAMDDEQLRREIAHNYDYFQRSLRDHLALHPGKYALLKGQRVIGFFDTPGDADYLGATRFPDGLYSIQQVTPQPVELGMYVNALD